MKASRQKVLTSLVNLKNRAYRSNIEREGSATVIIYQEELGALEVATLVLSYIEGGIESTEEDN